MFKFKGISSEEMQVVIAEEEHFIARAAQRYGITEIEGKDGALFDEQGYSFVERPIYVQCLNINKIDDILAWLNGEGEFEYKGRKTTARFFSQLEPQRNACIRIIDTTFIRDPFWYKANEEFKIVKESKLKEIEGNPIQISDSSDLPCEIVPVGNVEQATRDGYNLCNAPYTVDNKYTFTAEKDDHYEVLSYYATLEAGVEYEISFESDGSFGMLPSTDTVQMFLIKDKQYNYSYTLQGRSDNVFTPEVSGDYYIRVDINKSGATHSFWNFFIRKSTETREFELFGASPSPDHPSKIVTVGQNENLLDLANSDLKTYSGVSYLVQDGEIVFNGTATQNLTLFFPNRLNIEAKEYTLSITKTGKISGSIGYYIYPNEGNAILDGGNLVTASDFTYKSKTFDSEYKNCNFGMFISSGSNLNDFRVKPKLEKGGIATPHSPHGQGSVEIDAVNKNYAKIIPNQTLTATGITVTTNEDQSITMNGTGTGVRTFKITDVLESNDYAQKMDYSKRITPKGDYKVSLEVLSGTLGSNYTWGIMYTDGTNTDRANKTTSDAVSITNKEISFIYIYQSSKVFNNFTFRVSIQDINDNGIYVPHQSKTIILPIQKEFVKIGEHEDTFIKQNGKWYEAHYSPKVIFDGTETGWVQNYTGNGNPQYYIKLSDIPSAVSNGISSHFKHYVNSVKGYTFYINVSAKLAVFPNPTLNGTSISTLEEWKAWLAEQYANGTPVIIYYVLSEPELIECTAEQEKILNSFKTYKNVTHISADGIATLRIKYLMETNEKIINEGNIESRPLLRLEKTYNNIVELTINNIRFKYNFKEETYVQIDCEEKTVEYEGLNRNRQIEIGYEFPKLNIKGNDIIMHSGDCIIKVLRKDRWL